MFLIALFVRQGSAKTIIYRPYHEFYSFFHPGLASVASSVNSDSGQMDTSVESTGGPPTSQSPASLSLSSPSLTSYAEPLLGGLPHPTYVNAMAHNYFLVNGGGRSLLTPSFFPDALIFMNFNFIQYSDILAGFLTIPNPYMKLIE